MGKITEPTSLSMANMAKHLGPLAIHPGPLEWTCYHHQAILLPRKPIHASSLSHSPHISSGMWGTHTKGPCARSAIHSNPNILHASWMPGSICFFFFFFLHLEGDAFSPLFQPTYNNPTLPRLQTIKEWRDLCRYGFHRHHAKLPKGPAHLTSGIAHLHSCAANTPWRAIPRR